MSKLILSRLAPTDGTSLDRVFHRHEECQLTLKLPGGRYAVKKTAICPDEWDRAEFRIAHSRSPFDILVCPASHHESLVSVYKIRVTLEVTHPVQLLRALSDMEPKTDRFNAEIIQELVELRLQEKIVGLLQGVAESEVKKEINKKIGNVVEQVGLTSALSALEISSMQIDVSEAALSSKSSGDLQVQKMKMTFRRVVDSLVVSKQKTTLDDVIVLGNCRIEAQGCTGTIWLKEGQSMDNRKMKNRVKVLRSNFDLARMLMRIETEGEL